MSFHMSITPLPVFEADADARHRTAMSDEELYAQLTPPETVVVRFGYLKLIGEYAYNGKTTPGCGTKLVARTHRGTELVEMLTTTCENAGCAKSVTRNEMLQYIENSGGNDFPFYTNGKILRIATIEDLNKQSAINSNKEDYTRACKELIKQMSLAMKLVDVEPILGGELLTFYFMSEARVDFRELVRELAAQFKSRIEMRQVGARDEARLVADYERCGQHCCCKNFLKVLRPVSMKSAKQQRVPLDPLKISGRCGRLMCCLRYEDYTYQQLKKDLPARNSRVGTRQGPGIVLDTKILVQLVLVRLEHNDEEIAVPVEELMDPEKCPAPGSPEWDEAQEQPDDALRGLSVEETEQRTDDEKRTKPRRRRSRKRKRKSEQQDSFRETAKESESKAVEPKAGEAKPEANAADAKPRSKRRRRRRRRRPPP